MSLNTLITLDDIIAAQPLVREYLLQTPIVTSQGLNALTGMNLHFKAEMFQKTGSFKPRGMLNKINSLIDEEKGAV